MPIQVPASPLAIQISTNAQGKTVSDGPSTWIPTLQGVTRMELFAPEFGMS